MKTARITIWATLAAGMLALSGSSWAESVGAPDLKPADVEALAKVARLVLAGKVKSISEIPTGVVTPALVKYYTEEVSIVLFKDRAPLSRYSFAGKNLLDDTFGMMMRAAAMPGHLFYGFDQSDDVGVFVELVTTREVVKPADWKKRLSLLGLGLEGLEVSDQRDVPEDEITPATETPKTPRRKFHDILLPSWAVIGELDSRDSFIFRLCERMKLYPRRSKESQHLVMPAGSLTWDEKQTKVAIIGTRSFVVLPGQKTVQELFRMNTRPEAPPTDSLLGIARTAADHVCDRQLPDGSFCLSFRPSTGDVNKSYDMIVHGLAVESLLDLYERTKEPRYLEAARRGVAYALSLTREDKGRAGVRRFVVFEEQAQLGSTALTLENLVRLAALDPTGKLDKFDVGKTTAEMAQFLIDMQYDDGSFRYSFQYDPKVPLHYESLPAHPDMAVWALFEAGLSGQNQTWVDSAKSGLDYLVTKREASMNWDQPPAFTWLARSLRMYARNADKKYADYLFRMADTLIAEQYSAKSDRGPDVVGAYAANVQQLVAATACKMEVVNEAAILARLMKDDRAERYSSSAKLASGFLAANRFRPENSFYRSNSDVVQGDFRAGLFRSTVTLETEAFAIESLLTLEEPQKIESAR